MIEKVNFTQAAALLTRGMTVYKMTQVTLDTTIGELMDTDLLCTIIKEEPAEPQPEEPKKRTPVDHGRICQMYEDGFTVKDIVNELGCSPPTVIKTLKERGLWKKNG